MVRSMYSGVAGLRSHQTRMDTIGNNISNVNTYGFKSGRTTFRDIYYQTMTSASAPNAAMGGINPSAVGYGSQVGSVDLMMGRSTFSMTDQTMDLAIDGDGFFQVQDAAGNIYYTRAGMLNFDAVGNLVDMQGNYVLGINGDPSGKAPGTERIQVILPQVTPTASSVVQTINGKEFTITTTNNTTDGNLNMNFSTDRSVPDGEIVAEISTTGIVVKMNPDNVYRSWDELNTAINDAIIAANDNKEHAAGRFEISYTGEGVDPMAEASPTGLTAAELTNTDYGIQKGSAAFGTGKNFFGGISPSGVGNGFSGVGEMDNFTAKYTPENGNNPAYWSFSLEVGGQTYSGTVDSTRVNSGEFYMRNDDPSADKDDYIVMKRPSFNTITAAYGTESGTIPAGEAAKYVQAAPSAPLGSTTAFDFADVSVTLSSATLTVKEEADEIVAKINADSALYTATADANGNITVTAKAVGLDSSSPDFTNWGTVNSTNTGQNPIDGTAAFTPVTTADINAPKDAYASYPSKNLGWSGSAFALRGGTTGGTQTIADMTGISIGSSGIITGWDSQGLEIIIGRIDIVTFANPAGLNQAGSSNYTESANSGEPILNQPGTGGAGKLVGGTLELSNVDLSREFSDMITTQRGYQANSRIITVSDTMLEELINLKR